MMTFSRYDFFLHVTENDKQERHKKQQQHCAHQHTAYRTHCQRTRTVATHSSREYHRKQSEYHGQRSHQDGTETGDRCGDRRCRDAHTSATAFGSVFRLEDGGLGKQTDKHNDAGLHIDVVLDAEQFGKKEATEQSERNGEYDGKRYEQTLI